MFESSSKFDGNKLKFVSLLSNQKTIFNLIVQFIVFQ